MWTLSSNLGEPAGEMRRAFMQTLVKLMGTNERIVMLEADLGGASGSNKSVGKAYPDRYFDVGISEANMMGMAAGLSMRGFVPFVHTFAPFASRRAADQVYLEGAYARNTFTIYASDPGVCAEHNGGTHSTYEDVAFMRAIPEAEVYHPADPVQFTWLVESLADRSGLHYVRAARKSVPAIYAPGSRFEIGQASLLRQGEDVLLVACGEMVADALAAAGALDSHGVSSTVLDMFTLKPFDAKSVLAHAAGKRLVVTMENHSVIGGLGSAVAEVLSEAGLGVALRRVGVPDRFGQVGSVAYLKESYGLTPARAVSLALDFIHLKAS